MTPETAPDRTEEAVPPSTAWPGLSSRAEGVLAINLAAVIFGSAALFGKLNVSPFWIVALRAGFAALTLGLLGGFKLGRVLPISFWIRLALSGALLALHWLTFFMSVQWAGVAVATLTFATFPMFTVLLEAGVQRRFPTPTELAIGCVIIVAVALLVEPGAGESNLLGAAVGLASAASYAVFWHVGQGGGMHIPALPLSFYQNLFAFAAIAPTLVLAAPAPSHAHEWLALLTLGIINTALMLQIYQYALRRISASTCSGFIALEPVYAILFAALIFHEPITPWIVVSIVLIIGASLTLLKIEQKPLPPG